MVRYDLGAKVVSADGKDVGEVDQLVLDPRTETIRELVIHKGVLVQHDIIIPTSSVRESAGVDDNTLHLTLSAGEISRLPQFEETAYVAPPLGLSSDGGMYPGDMLSTNGLLWPAPMYSPGPTREFGGVSAPDMRSDDRISDASTGTVENPIEQSRPDDVFITSGTDVYVGGDKIGTLDEVEVDEGSDKVTTLVVKHGLFGGEKVRIPAQYIQSASRDAIQLTMPAGSMERFRGGKR